MKTFDTYKNVFTSRFLKILNSPSFEKKEEIERKPTSGRYRKNTVVGKILWPFVISRTRPIKISVSVVYSLEIISTANLLIENSIFTENSHILKLQWIYY